MKKEDARVIACGLLHDGLDDNKLTPKAREEIRAAITRLLDLVPRQPRRTSQSCHASEET